MTLTRSKQETSEYIQSLSIAEIKALFADGTPVKMNWADDEDFEQSERIYLIMDLTDLEYADVLRLLNEPRKAPLGDIETYCRAMNINILDFIQNALS